MKQTTGNLRRALASKIQKVRHDAELSQADLSKKIHLSRAAIANIETFRQEVSLELLYKIGVACNVDPRDLLPSPEEVAPYSTDENPEIKQLEEKLKTENLSDDSREIIINYFLTQES